MKKYFESIKSREPHHRRMHALRAAGVVTALIFVVWFATLPLRLQGPALPVADDSNQTSLTAAVQQAAPDNSQPQLQVSTTSVFQ